MGLVADFSPQQWAFGLAVATLGLISAIGSWNGRNKISLVPLFAIISAGIITVSGQDSWHHIARTIILADQAKSANLDLLFNNYMHGETLPIFLYYSIIPYVPPALLNLAGIPAATAYKLALIGYLGIFLLGIINLASSRTKNDRHASLLAILLLIGSNYIVGLWLIRSALAEILSFSLVPWIVSALMRSPSSSPTTFLLLTLQAAIHPILMLHSLLAEFVGAWALSRGKVIDLIRNNTLILACSLLASSPFWLPAVVYRSAILGPEALPIKFYDTFLSLSDLINPLSWKTPGLALFVVTLVAIIRPKGKYVVITTLLFCMTLFVQTTYGRFIGSRLPLVDSSIFIWRLLFVTSFLGFILFLLISSHINLGTKRSLSLWVIITVSMFTITSVKSGNFLKAQSNETELRSYLEVNRSWGIAEYFPDYRNLPSACSIMNNSSSIQSEFAAIDNKNGIKIGGTGPKQMLAIPKAPLKFVSYKFNGTKIQPLGSCNDSLIFGPLTKPGLFAIDKTSIIAISWIRLVAIFGIFTTSLFTAFHYLRSRHRRKHI